MCVGDMGGHAPGGRVRPTYPPLTRSCSFLLRLSVAVKSKLEKNSSKVKVEILTNSWMGGRDGRDASLPTKDGHDRKADIFHWAANPGGEDDDVGKGAYNG